jgi:uncharacterized protein (UPF0332 family)
MIDRKIIDKKRVDEAKSRLEQFFQNNLVKKDENKAALFTYIKNSELSLKVAEKLMKDLELKPYLWIVVCSYYSMFYIANAILLKLGYKIGDEDVHRVTNEALIALVFDRLKRGLLEEYEETMENALEIASIKAGELLENYEREKAKRKIFQYEMDEDIKKGKAETSLKRAKEFIFEIKKLIYDLEKGE